MNPTHGFDLNNSSFIISSQWNFAMKCICFLCYACTIKQKLYIHCIDMWHIAYVYKFHLTTVQDVYIIQLNLQKITVKRRETSWHKYTWRWKETRELIRTPSSTLNKVHPQDNLVWMYSFSFKSLVLCSHLGCFNEQWEYGLFSLSLNTLSCVGSNVGCE